jgi:hypothetical protein
VTAHGPTHLAVLLLTLASAVAGWSQQATPGPASFRYSAAQLDCATFLEHSGARLQAETGSRRRRETLARDGVLRLRATAADSGIAIEAWYDSLALSRESPETTLVPDTDGLLGGRFRGTLSPTGQYAVRTRPFIPDEVAEVADVGLTMDDLLPPLPPPPMAVGRRWTNGEGLELERLPDSVAAGRTIHRLALRAHSKSDAASIRGDTTQLAATATTAEDGEVDWDPERGLLRRRRHLVIETTVPAGGPLKLPLRSRLEQEVELVRGSGGCEGK